MNPANPQREWAWLARIRHAQGRKGEVFADILTDFPEKFAERKQVWLIADPDSPRAKAPPGKPSQGQMKAGSLNMKGAGFSMKGAGFSMKGTGFSPYIEALRRTGALAPEATPSQTELTAHWLHKGGIVLHFAGSETISDAEALAGLIVAIPAEQRAALEDDEIYIADLIGCTLFDVAGASPVEVGLIEEVDRSAGPVALLVIGQPGSAEEILVPFAKSFLRRIDLEAKRVEMALPEGLLDLNLPGKP